MSDMHGLHGRPTSTELVEAVREFLENDVFSSTEGRVQFHTRVAINALNIVQRELELGPAQASAHRDRLAALGVADERELATAIRDGRFDDRIEAVTRAVAATVTDKLRVANPKRL